MDGNSGQAVVQADARAVAEADARVATADGDAGAGVDLTKDAQRGADVERQATQDVRVDRNAGSVAQGHARIETEPVVRAEATVALAAQRVQVINAAAQGQAT